MKTWNFPRRKQQRHDEATERAAERATRSTKHQIERLDAGHFRAEKERARLES